MFPIKMTKNFRLSSCILATCALLALVDPTSFVLAASAKLQAYKEYSYIVNMC